MLKYLSTHHILLNSLVICLLFVGGCGGSSNSTTPNSNIDNTPPVITLNGVSQYTLFVNNDYVELGATANDAIDGAVQVIIEGTVDTNQVGQYTVTYSAVDRSGNSTVVTRTIVVVELTDPSPFAIMMESDKYDNNTISIRTAPGGNYSFRIDWGDGSSDENITQSITHNYTESGIYLILIEG